MVESGIAVAAFGIGIFFNRSPIQDLRWSLKEFLIGLAGTLPLLGIVQLLLYLRVKAVADAHRFLLKHVGPLLDECGFRHLVLLSLLAGVCEELLFRGVLYPLCLPSGVVAAVIITNALFGCAHWISPAYVLITFTMGLWLTALLHCTPERSLLAPMTTHTVYDFIAFILVRREYRAQSAVEDPEALPEA